MALHSGKRGTGDGMQSCCLKDIVSGSHEFIIHGYSLIKGIGSGKCIRSETFAVSGYEWAIYFYPDGKSAKDNSLYISIFIGLVGGCTDSMDMRALFELTLLDQSINAKHKVLSHFNENRPCVIKYGISMWGNKRFIRRMLLENSDFLKKDTLMISCTVGVILSSLQGPKLHSIQVPEPDLSQHFAALFDSGEGDVIFGHDVTFDVDGEVFQAHKLVLAARSPVFKAQLYGPLCNRNNRKIHIEDMKAPVFKAMLHFIYTDLLPDTKEITTSASLSPSTLMAQHLFVAADRYGLERLRLLCESKLCEDVSIHTVSTTLALAEQHHASQLKAICLNYAGANLADVMQSDDFEHLKDSCPSVLTELLRRVAGMYAKVGSGTRSVWGQPSDWSDPIGRRVRPQT